ncbi:cadherin repeat domain-containing protein [Sulfurimonas sp.]|uniref:cadherin repeat domain-containing protein n=1 Tax=Sulfurimonas sp. TaxID=2022749 RepID=UPI0025CCF53E|nr:cadherin repeat domain-containing protein [Sulfurimonas sp.]
MKTLNFKFSFFLSIFFTIHLLYSTLSALTLPHIDSFESSSLSGWSRDDGDKNELKINQDRESHKTFDFTSTYKNISVTVTFQLKVIGGWETSGSYKDYFKTQFNDGTVITKSKSDGTYSMSYSTSLDTDGKLKISFSTDTASSDELVKLDNVTIEATNPIIPIITPATYTIYNEAPTDTVVGTIVSTGSPTSFSILSGDIDSIFAVNDSGDITIESNPNLESNTTNSYTLEINASNTSGFDVENFVMNLTDDIDLSSENVNTRAFTNVSISGKDSVTINGSILQIGNQLLCKNNSDGASCEEPSLGTPNNSHNQHKAKIDTSSGAPSSNTMAKLVMETGDEVIFARLYWSARIDNITSTQKDSAKTIQLKGPNATSYTSYTSTNAKYNWHKSGSTFDYVASQDVTDYIKAQGAGEYYAGGIVASNGYNQYASWQLIVIVENTSRSLKNISLFDGFYSVSINSGYPRSATADASGFITPTGSDPFNANLFIYMGESDGSYGDSVKILKKDGDVNVGTDWLSLVDGANTSTDVVNASVYSLDYTSGYRSNDSGMANPNYRNVLGVDIDKLPINIKEDTSKQKLSNSQVETKIKISSTQDRFSLNMFAFETEVFVPEFCYDYSYSQYDQYFTEDNDGSNPPVLSGDVTVNEPIKMSIFVKSLVDSSITISNMSVDISDINRTQATYISDSTLLAKVGDATPDIVTVTSGQSLDGASDYINNIFIGTLEENDYFYIYYDLDPQMSTMDIPINVVANYDLALDSASVEYSLKLSEEIPLCTTSNFNYAPAKGIFNIAHNNFYTYNGSSGNKYYNIPTQVTKREGNFKVLAMDPDDRDTLLNDHPTTIVAVEMIDAGAFHYTDASCKELASSISEKVWVIVDENSTSSQFNKAALESAIADNMTDLTNSYDFYTKARQNTAFRVTYNASDVNGSITDLTKNATNDYSINNFTYAGGNCAQDMNDNNDTTDDAVDSYCTSNMTKSQLASCMECTYGINTRFICSRDNFAIRPEALIIKINDQNQTNPASKLKIDDDISGVITPSTDTTHLSAGYQYNLEVNASNYLDNTSSFGYTKSFTGTSSDVSTYEWSPTGVSSGCNDDSNSTVSFSILNGEADFNSSLNQVGEYVLKIEDTTWTSVDSNSTYMSHHDGDSTYFISSATSDCVSNSADTQIVNSNIKNGCNINSNHDASGTSLKYRNYKIEFHPYKFDISSDVTLGLTNRDINTTNDFSNFVYMANINNVNDINMSVQVNSSITPQGYDNSSLSNFVTQCYAKPIDINISKSAPLNTNLNLIYIISDRNTTGNTIASIANVSNEDANITTPNTFFAKDMNGTLNSIMSLNFDRNQNIVSNPEDINYSKVTVYDPRTFFNADLDTNKTAANNITINGLSGQNVTHYFGRTAGRKTRIVCENSPCISGENEESDVLIYYETYCFGTTNSNTCDRTLLPTLSSRYIQKVDSRWYVNLNHNQSGDGNLTASSEAAGLVTVPTITNLNNYTKDSEHSYNTANGLPYTATMNSNISNWLIYDEDDTTATTNKNIVIFQSATDWSGQHETNTTTQTEKVRRVNRRTLW